jgi:hypothetical protein
MSHDSRILIADLMFPEHVGSSQLGLASFDMTMFNMGGKERTEANFKRLLEDVGCELVQVWRSQEGFGVIVEGRLKGTKEKIIDEPLPEADQPSLEDTIPATASDTKTSDVPVEHKTPPAPEQLSEPVQEPVAETKPLVEAQQENGNSEESRVADAEEKNVENVNGTSHTATNANGATEHVNGNASKDENPTENDTEFKPEGKDETESSVPVNGD